MELMKYFEMQYCCRICLCDKAESYGIFEEVQAATGATIAKILSECTRYKVEHQDELPQQICSECKEQACNAYTFKQQVENTYRELMLLLGKSTVEKSKEQGVQTDEFNLQFYEPHNQHVKMLTQNKELQKQLFSDDEVEMDLKEDTLNTNSDNLLNATALVNPIISDDEVENMEFEIKVEQAADSNDADSSNDEEQQRDMKTETNAKQLLKVAHKKTTKSAQSNKIVHKKPVNVALNIKPTVKKTEIVQINIDNNETNCCAICQHSFASQWHLRRHMLVHERPHNCTHCAKTFTTNDYLKRHMARAHKLEERSCAECNEEFANKAALNNHNEKQHGILPNAPPSYDCEHCPKKFTNKTNWYKHRVLHRDERNFLCALCGESFMRNDYLVVHMRRHTGEKPFKCQYCEKSFPRATDVKMHERYHTDSKPKVCNICGKGFHRAYNLTLHMRAHTGERPYKCDQCAKSFKQSSDLKTHLRRHTGERYACTVCNASYFKLYDLSQHALSVHGIQKKCRRAVQKISQQHTQELSEEQDHTANTKVNDMIVVQ